MESEDGVGRKQERGEQTIWGGQESANSTKRTGDRRTKVSGHRRATAAEQCGNSRY